MKNLPSENVEIEELRKKNKELIGLLFEAKIALGAPSELYDFAVGLDNKFQPGTRAEKLQTTALNVASVCHETYIKVSKKIKEL